jgi:type II secretory pathway pseudopilin PulG
MELLIALAVLGIALLLIIGPLRSASHAAAPETPRSDARAELEAAKEAKYREIRDAELDYRTGKLSREDWQLLDSSLRAEAIALLDRLGSHEARDQSKGDGPAGVDSDHS